MALDANIRGRLSQLVERSSQPWNSRSDMVGWTSEVLTMVSQLHGFDSFQAHYLQENLIKLRQGQMSETEFIAHTSGILTALRSDFEGGFLADLRGELRAEVEGNLLAQAQRLLEGDLKDPAAMLVGAVLEDALRHLCKKNNLPEGITIESMNVPLRSAGVYGVPQQQQVTAWAAIRNKADHGRFGEYDIREVRLMHMGVTDFLVKYLEK